MEDEEGLDWDTVMKQRMRALTSKSVQGYIHWIGGALHEFNYLSSPCYLEHKEITVDYRFANN
jgi:hypothetical protein